MTAFVITWEPWTPVDVKLGKHAQYKVQPRYANAAIAAGTLDDYLTRFARSVAAAKDLTVYIRFAHEMNGDWYPWSHDPAAYVKAWRHIVDVFRRERATNAKFVFSVHPELYVTDKDWLAGVAPYWPGADYVDQTGATVINFGGQKEYAVDDFAARLALMHKKYPVAVMLTEVDTASDGRVRWLSDLRTFCADTPWVSGVVWSQSSQSRGAQQLGSAVGDMDWDVTEDMTARPVIQGLMADLQR